MGIYQVWCILWHASRGDLPLAQLCAMLPADMFAEGDAVMRAAFAAGAAEAARNSHGPKPDSGAAGGD